MDNVENFFQKKLKESLESYRIPYDQNAWEKLSNSLDNQRGKKNLLTRLLWIFLLLPLLAWNIHLQHKINIIESSKTDVVIYPKTSIKVDTIIKYVDKIIYQIKPIYIREKIIADNNLTNQDSEQNSTIKEDLYKLSKAFENENQQNETTSDMHNALISNEKDYDKMICDALENIQMDYKIKLLSSSKENLLENITSNEYPMNLPKKVRKLRTPKTNEISIGMIQSMNINKINDQSFQICYNRSLWNNLYASLGLQYSNSNLEVTHHEVTIENAIPAPHQLGDNLTSIYYHYRSIGIPIQLTYNLLSKKKVNPYLLIGVQFQKKMCCDLDYYYTTHNSEGYSINKLATLNKWNSYFQLGIGADFPLYQKIKGFGAFQLKSALDNKKLFDAENNYTQFLLGIKFKI